MSQSGGRSTSEVRLPSGVHDAAAFLITHMLAMNDEGRSDEYILLAIMAELSGWFALSPPVAPPIPEPVVDTRFVGIA